MSTPFSRWMCYLLAVLAAGVGVQRVAAEGQDEARLAFFEQRIRPVLVDHCYECHSAQSKKLKGGLRLDFKAGVLKGGETRPAVVPWDASHSLLIESVRYTNHDLQMPPKARLSEAIIADLTKWVNDGAFDPREEGGALAAAPTNKPAKPHWAFQPIRKIEPPAFSKKLLPSKNPIDRLVVAKLIENGLSMAPAADKRTLIRRACFDLTGLPPSPEEIHAFELDAKPGAFERMVDRLLASPRYGERWGRWWLDVARYADTNGQDENKVMANAWRYRDWVIRSFNANQRFDAFTAEQLAGDLLPPNGLTEEALFERWTATGFLVLGPKMLAEQDKPKLVMDLVDEQIDVVSRAFLGLTVGCARCHDHKFDPIPASDYYALAGIFRSTKTMENLAFVSKFNERRVTPASHLAAIETHQKKLTALTNQVNEAIQKANAELTAGWRTNLDVYLDALAGKSAPASAVLPTNLVAKLSELKAADPATNGVSRVLRRMIAEPDYRRAFLTNPPPQMGGANGLRLAPGKVDAGFLATGGNHLEIPSSQDLEPAQLTIEAWVRAVEFPSGGDERRWLVSKNANEWAEGHYALMLDHDRAGAYLNIGGGAENVYAIWGTKETLKLNQWHHLAMTYDGMVLRLFVDGNPAGEMEVKRPRVPGSGPLVLGRRPDGYVHFKGLLDEVRVYRRSLTAAELKTRFDKAQVVHPEDVVARWEFNDLTEADREALAVAETKEALFGTSGVFALPKDPRPLYPTHVREGIVALEQARDNLRANGPAPAAFALAVQEDKPVDLPIHIRGSHLNPAKEPVPRGFVQVAWKGEKQPLPSDRSGRLELARWLTSPDNPLTARVIVNRIWQAHFGEGLVRTSDNFGVRGEAPSNPELLDWLAGEFMRSGWDIKQLHRLILSSATWRQVGSGGLRARPALETKHARAKDQRPPDEDYIERAMRADPDNRLLWHFPRQRLEAEMIRDALLAVSGRLDVKTGGSLVSWKNDDYTPNDEVSASSTRRSVYLPVVRDRVYDVFTIFDFANPSVGTSKRVPTVVSHQALFFLNSPLVKASAKAFAQELMASSSVDETRIRLAHERAFGRPSSAAESKRASEFIAGVPRKKDGESELAAWAAWCQMLFASNEFIYLE